MLDQAEDALYAAADFLVLAAWALAAIAPEHLRTWMKDLVPGALVVEVTDRLGSPLERVGHLVEVDLSGPEPSTTIIALDGLRTTWDDGRFVRLPQRWGDWFPPGHWEPEPVA